MHIMQSRRDFLTTLSTVGAAGVLGGGTSLAAEGPPETTTIKLAYYGNICLSPLLIAKDLLHAEGAYLTFDEVKTGFTTGPAGATGRYDVTPDIVCLAKALGGGISVAAIGGVEEVMSAIADGRYEQVGTFNGNPLAMAATPAASPSSPSRKLTVLIAPMNQTSVTGTTSQSGKPSAGFQKKPSPKGLLTCLIQIVASSAMAPSERCIAPCAAGLRS